jgi:tetratricopeptide (TPR) repeat protein
MLRPGRWLLAAAWLAASSALALPSRGQSAPAPRTEEELAAARKLFADALNEEQARRFDVALEAFRRVREVRDTAPVEYRIGTCLEGLGRLAEALSAYDAAVRLGEGDAAQADLVAGSRDRIDVLSKRVAHLSLTPSSHAAPDAEMRVDGTRRPAGDIVLDPGSHRVEATASGAAPFQRDI